VTEGKLFDRGKLHLLAAPFRPIRLSDDGNYVFASIDKHLQGGAGELRCPHEQDS
jgi:hypothetical protein